MTTKILIVDDDPRMRKSLANLLNPEGRRQPIIWGAMSSTS